jgi:hypothetical protein
MEFETQTNSLRQLILPLSINNAYGNQGLCALLKYPSSIKNGDTSLGIKKAFLFLPHF